MNKKNLKYIFLVAAMGMSLTSCEDMFEPTLENNLGVDYMYNNASYAEGVLGNGYTRIASLAGFTFSEVATDDAVSNDDSNSWRKITSGQWSSDNNPAEMWRNCRAGIQYMNLFLNRADKVHWADDEVAAAMYNNREKGEAYAMRAMFMYMLLQAHGGYDAQGNLLGVPIVTEEEDAQSEFNLPRNSFKECMQAIYDDCAKALELLPTKYVEVTSASEIPAKYKGATVQQYNRVFGSKFNGRVDGSIVEAYRAKAALLAASPAFAAGSGTTYQQAADYAAQVLDRIGGVAGMDPTGWTWYCNKSEIEGLDNGKNPKEILWRGEKSNSESNNNWEKDNYPPTLYGKGRVNPTQNFVDAFGMADGQPITSSEYDAKNPYANRDPRLAAFVLYNGQTAGPSNSVINTQADGTSKDALNKESGSSTRTGYYMKKLLRQDVNLNPTSSTYQFHYQPRIRFTEIFLNYAEAANEAYGPTGKGSHGYSAYDVIKAIRSRAGVGTGAEGDKYLEECAKDAAKMRELIRNERRIELSFEGFRFWDLRRWQAPVNVTAQGMSITTDAQGNTIYQPVDVEKRSYQSYMNYGPIPYSECLKFSNLVQNQGW